jgi:single-strand DNA-binding protein
MVNRIILSGTLSRDPEMSYTSEGTAITRLSLKTTRVNRLGAKEQEVVSFISALASHQLAEECNTFLRNDMEVYMVGELAVDSYKGRDHLRHTIVNVIASEISLPDGTVFRGGEDEDEDEVAYRAEGEISSQE